MKAKRKIINSTDADGASIVRVQLAAGRHYATLNKDDFERLIALGVSPNWSFNADSKGAAYVRVQDRTRKNLVGLARIILNAGPGQVVRYRDGNTLNLRTENLYLSSGFARKSDAALVAASGARGRDQNVLLSNAA